MDTTPEKWVIDTDGWDRPGDMAECILRNKGTEAEWVAVGYCDDEGYAASVAYCHPGNAPLIAAAPDLLAALEAMVNMEDWSQEDIDPQSTVGRAYAAIAAAKGEA